MNTTSALFRIDAVHEIHRDPGGHYHHWSILEGQLLQGTLSIGEWLAMPTTDGVPCSARIGGFTAFRKQFGTTLQADEYDGIIGVMVTKPAPNSAFVLTGEATLTTQETHDAYLLHALEHFPSRLFHPQGQTEWRCRECSQGLLRLPQSKPLLERWIQSPPTPFIGEAAASLLTSWRS